MFRLHFSPLCLSPASRAAVGVLLAVGIGSTHSAAGAAEPASQFARDVFPLLQSACFECHGGRKQEGGLRLDVPAGLLESGAVVPGKPDESELIRRVRLARNHDEVMPAVGETLSREQVVALERWIAAGAKWPEDFETPRHWSLVPPRKAPLPTPEADDPDRQWPRRPIDFFALKRMRDAGLRPSPPAAPETLLRRLYLDLTGLPPTPAELDRFLADPSDVAYEQVVDELLQRPQFGERWARPWLDLARYADSHGFQRDDLREVWAYRDWVIRALNKDMPFDRFTIEQLAGDLLPDATESQRIATGFHRCTPTNVEAGSLPEETRTEQLIDRVNTTGAIWLGVTMECAQCHDHKYDPFTMKDYYQLLAFFNNTEIEADRANPQQPSSIRFIGPSMPLANPRQNDLREQLQSTMGDLKRQQTRRREMLANDLDQWAQQLADASRHAPVSHALEVLEFRSLGEDDPHQILDDGSVLLTGTPPDKDVYTAIAQLRHNDIRALRIDALTHEKLPGKGPGRGDPVRRNFILSEFTAELDGKPLEFASATADFSQNRWPVAAAIDGDPSTGWAISPQFGKDHWATFVLKEPIRAGEGKQLTLRISQQYGTARTIGRFRLTAITGDPQHQPLPPAVSDALARPATQRSEAERKALLDHRIAEDTQWADWQREIAKQQTQLDKLKPDTTLVMVELPEPRVTHIYQRGDYRNPGEVVQPDAPASLHPLPANLPPASEGQVAPANRLTLARWIVDPANPLVARVTVNRWWAELFGRGIVSTVEDFGVKGDAPTHPDLLDYLAVDFVEHGWSMKHVLRSIVLSATYRQSSVVTPDLLARDDSNRWLARGPRLRMDAEMIRDNALAVSGLLSLRQFGAPIRPYQPDGIWSKVGGMAYKYEASPGSEQHRRGIYVVLKRGAPYPSFVNFDASARLSCVVKRSRTNTPLQALTLLNDPVYVEAAKSLAARMATAKLDLDEQLELGFRLCTSRRPELTELSALRRLFELQVEAGRNRMNEGKPLVEPLEPVTGVSAAEFAAWYSVATALLNLHETITKS